MSKKEYYNIDFNSSVIDKIMFYLAKETNIDYYESNLIREDLTEGRQVDHVDFFEALPETSEAKKLFFTYLVTDTPDVGICTTTLHIAAHPKDIVTIEKLMRHIEYLGQVGASRNILVRIDGDGTGRIKVIKGDGSFIDTDKYNLEQESGAIVGTYDIG